ncbi:WD40 repeat-like protein [Jaminaea rosea]|uniref:WD40 repeat-like protein n=1 Tax=Jaminaea rosea TaxID=1569628 RepID=A0A316UMC4_9BASI|nr:WD40 repeat-like protein [Jaminaea rosea]PWN26442.1 WD40 repeat-like protein [Jaminaea rosea]
MPTDTFRAIIVSRLISIVTYASHSSIVSHSTTKGRDAPFITTVYLVAYAASLLSTQTFFLFIYNQGQCHAFESFGLLCAQSQAQDRSIGIIIHSDQPCPEWLAVGDNEGTLSLIDTSIPASDTDIRRPNWKATTGSLFSVSWRFDDRFIATSGSDYSVKVWDTASGKLVNSFHGSRGTARTIEWDPAGNGHLLASGGRDGAVHVYDTRTPTGHAVMNLGHGAGSGDEADRGDEPESLAPLLSLWSAHANSYSGVKRKTSVAATAPRGVTSISYHRHHQHNLITTGCTDARIKMWDLRFAVARKSHGSQQPRSGDAAGAPSFSRVPFSDVDVNAATPYSDTLITSSGRRARKVKPRKARPGSPSFVLGPSDHVDSELTDTACTSSEERIAIKPVYESNDLSTSVGHGWNARAHGISSIVGGIDDEGHGSSSSHTLWAACTDGRIYGVPYHLLDPAGSSSFDILAQRDEELASIETLYHPTQRGNSLYNRLSLCPDGRTLALGCNSGDVLLWDVKAKTPTVLRRFALADSSAALSGTGAHQRNCEVNSVSWCFAASGGEGDVGKGSAWKLASAADDCVVRTWTMDRALSGERSRRLDGDQGCGEEEDQYW